MSLIFAANLLNKNIESIIELDKQLGAKVTAIESSIEKGKWGAARRQLLFKSDYYQGELIKAGKLIKLDEIKASAWTPSGAFARNLKIYESMLTRLGGYCLHLARLQQKVDIHFTSYSQTGKIRLIGGMPRKRKYAMPSNPVTAKTPSRKDVCSPERRHKREDASSTKRTI